MDHLNCRYDSCAKKPKTSLNRRHCTQPSNSVSLPRRSAKIPSTRNSTNTTPLIVPYHIRLRRPVRHIQASKGTPLDVKTLVATRLRIFYLWRALHPSSTTTCPTCSAHPSSRAEPAMRPVDSQIKPVVRSTTYGNWSQWTEERPVAAIRKSSTSSPSPRTQSCPKTSCSNIRASYIIVTTR